MILLTGATGRVGRALLRRLTAAGEPVRCLVREPRRLGDARVRVQITLGDLADPLSFRHAMRGVDTVVHLAASAREQPGACIEELNGLATWGMLRAAERAGVRRFLYFSALGASAHHGVRFMRSKALAEASVARAALPHTVIAPSLVYAPGDRLLTTLQRLAWLPLVPLPGSGRALVQPIWAEDVADCVVAILAAGEQAPDRVELAGPDTLTHAAVAKTVLGALGRSRPLVKLPLPLVQAGLRGFELGAGPTTPLTAEQVALFDVEMTSSEGTAHAESLGVRPRSMGAVLGVGS
ncbi:MAG: NAD(P)H-binding protein [Solirubrobacteraceae bacterium]|nr:MAG: hypothetical protein DLM63_01550 [Solirubrobacterales bacterium]